MIKNNWHLSDHKPLEVSLSISINIPANSPYKRSIELNFSMAEKTPNIIRFKGAYDYLKINHKDYMISILERDIYNNNIENALCKLDDQLQKAHRIPGMRVKSRKINNNINSTV